MERKTKKAWKRALIEMFVLRFGRMMFAVIAAMILHAIAHNITTINHTGMQTILLGCIWFTMCLKWWTE